MANWSAEESEGWESVVDVSGGFSALQCVFFFRYNFLVIEKKGLTPVEVVAHRSPVKKNDYFLDIGL